MAVITDLLTSLGYHPIATLTSVFIVYQLVLALYCLTLHPLAHIPGPRIAAITYFYEFYYDFILGGQYTFKIARLHSKYGPILRISPCEVHINDPDFYDQIYTGTSEPREKWDRVMARMGNPSSHVATAGVVQHRARKAPLNQFFSQKSVFGLESLFVEKADRLCERIDEWKETGKVLNVQYAMSSFVIDVITEYSFAQSYGSLDHPEYVFIPVV
jgi:hypothetical protein